jgi:hypothetical protein
MRIDCADTTPWVLETPKAVAELERLGDEIAKLSAHLEAAAARLLELIRDFDARGGWGNGFRSCAAWLSWRVGLDLGAAREKVRVARALGTLPRLAEALARGELSYAKVRALTRVATPETEQRLLAVGRAGTAAHVERIVRGWRRVDRIAEAREAARRHASRGLQVYPDEDGMVVVRGRLESEAGALLMKAQGAARETLYRRQRTEAEACPTPAAGDASAETPPRIQQQADALAAPDPDDSPGHPAGAPAPGPGLPLPGLRAAVHPGASSPPLGGRRPDDPREPRAPLPPAPPGGPRGGLRGRARAGRRAALSLAERPAAPRGAGAGPDPGRPYRRPSGVARGSGAPPPRADGVPELARRASGPGMGHRRPASPGRAAGGESARIGSARGA